VRGTTLQTPRSVQKEGEEVLQAPKEQRFCSLWSRPWWAGCPCSHGGPRGSRSPLAAWGGPHAGAGGCPKEAVAPWREEPIPSSLFLKDCVQWERPTLGQGLSVRCPPCEEQGAANVG